MHWTDDNYKEVFPDPTPAPAPVKVESAVETFTPSDNQPEQVETPATDLESIVEPEEPAPAEIEVPAESEVSDGNE